MKAQRLIRPYLDGQLSDRELEEFLDHVEYCPDCRDELGIYFSIYETLGDETDDRDYDFVRKLYDRIGGSRRYLNRRHAYRRVFLACVILAEAFFLAGVSGLVRVRIGEIQSRIEAEAGKETESETEVTAAVMKPAGQADRQGKDTPAETVGPAGRQISGETYE